MLRDLFERQAAIQAQVERYTPNRKVVEGLLKAGKKVDAGYWWWISPGARKTRFNWENETAFTTPEGRDVAVKAFTDPEKYNFGYNAGNVQQALINVRVSLPENPAVTQELELPPVWAILRQNPDFSPEKVGKLTNALEEIVPLLRACLPQG